MANPKAYGRELPDGCQLCGDGETCGSVKSTIERHVQYKECNPDAGTCKQSHGACGCHLFKADSRYKHEKDPWVFAANPGVKVTKEDHMEYRCICTRKVQG